MQKENFPFPEGKKEEAILQSIHLNKIIIPIIIGIFTVAYLVWKQVEWKELKNISWNGFDASEIELLDATGRILSKEKPIGSEHSLNVTSLSNGVYFVKLKTSDKYYIRKFQKQELK